MSVEEVGIGAAVGMLAGSTVVGQQVQHVLDNREGVVAVEHASPEVGLPSQAPSRRHVASLVQRIGSGSEEVGMTIGRDLVRRIQAVEVGDVAMLVAWVVTVDEPFLQLSVAANLHGWEIGYGELETVNV